MSKFGQTKKILIKIIYVGKLPVTKIFRAPSGQVYSDKGIDRILMKVADNFEKSFTGSDFRLVVIDPRKNILKCPQFNFVELLKQTKKKDY